jgi:hypothetical protein
MPVDPATLDDDFDSLDDPALNGAEDVFSAWSADVATRLKAMFLTLEVYDPEPWMEDPEELKDRVIEYTGTIEDILAHIARWVEEVPARLSKLLANPALQPLFPAPELTFLIHKSSFFYAISPHFLNYPESRHADDARPYIDFTHASCDVKHSKEDPDRFLLTLPSDIAWSITEEQTIENRK